MLSENRAAAPNGDWPGGGPVLPPASAVSTPSPMPGDMADRRSPERKCRTLQGPSAKEWARHRETIISLYRQYPLKRVSEIMRRYHGFSARYVVRLAIPG